MCSLLSVVSGANEQNKEDLMSCYVQTLDLCVMRGVRSVAFPCIGTGDGNFSKQAACAIALRTVRQWLSDAKRMRYRDLVKQWQGREWHEEEKQQQQDLMYVSEEESVADRGQAIVFCCYDQANWALYKHNMPKMFPVADAQHSYLWTHRKRSLEHKQEMSHMRMHLESLQMVLI